MNPAIIKARSALLERLRECKNEVEYHVKERRPFGECDIELGPRVNGFDLRSSKVGVISAQNSWIKATRSVFITQFYLARNNS